VSCWDILDVSESFSGGCRVADIGLKNRTERAISLSEASRRRPTTDQHGRFVTAQVADADSPVRSARRWPQRIPAIPPRAGANGLFAARKATTPVKAAPHLRHLPGAPFLPLIHLIPGHDEQHRVTLTGPRDPPHVRGPSVQTPSRKVTPPAAWP
jgi:hypothetical protein